MDNTIIEKCRVLEEFIGEILPGSTPEAQLPDYAFTWDTTKPTVTNIIETIAHGNIWRFTNHHCKPNVGVQAQVISVRQIIALSAARNIDEGEELCSDYGQGDFVDRSMPCACTTKALPHTPPCKLDE